jgi:hypothetical protein
LVVIEIGVVPEEDIYDHVHYLPMAYKAAAHGVKSSIETGVSDAI